MKVITNKLPLKHIYGDLDSMVLDFVRILYVLAGLSIIFNSIYDVAFGIKAVLIILVSIIVSRETEIFFLTQKSDVPRAEAKEAIKITKPEVTGIIFALLLPVGTPIFVVIVGAFISIFVGKMIFGGYSFNVFNPAIIGRLFVGIAWPALVTINFPNIMDNYLLGLIFNKDYSIELLSPLMMLQENGIVSLLNMNTISSLLFKPNFGMMFSLPSIVYLLLIVHFTVGKKIDMKPILFSILASVIVLGVISIGFNLGIYYVLFHFLTGGFLFVTLFMMTDPFTKPFNSIGVLYYSVIFVFTFTLIRFLGKGADGVLNALLFSNLFVPLLNKKTKGFVFGLNKKSILAVVIMLLVLLGTGLFINSILGYRIEVGEVMVNAYVKS
ncbi:MAG: RnfABCDGE type electron transport complex subunit D [Spirochaetaceae bacterium]